MPNNARPGIRGKYAENCPKFVLLKCKRVTFTPKKCLRCLKVNGKKCSPFLLQTGNVAILTVIIFYPIMHYSNKSNSFPQLIFHSVCFGSTNYDLGGGRENREKKMKVFHREKI